MNVRNFGIHVGALAQEPQCRPRRASPIKRQMIDYDPKLWNSIRNLQQISEHWDPADRIQLESRSRQLSQIVHERRLRQTLRYLSRP